MINARPHITARDLTMAYGDFLIKQNLPGTGDRLLQHGIRLHMANMIRPGIAPYFLALIAIGPHILCTDHQLRQWHRHGFDQYLRWVLAAALLAGYILGFLKILPTALVVAITALISGAILINVMAEELPDKDSSRMTPFLAGIGIFVLVAMAIRSIPRIDI